MDPTHHHLRNVLAAVVAVATAVVLVVLQLPASSGITSSSVIPAAHADERPSPVHERWLALPPRLVPEAPVADAVTPATAPPPTTTAPPTTAPPATTTTTAPSVPRPERIRALVDFPFEQVAPGWRIEFVRAEGRGLLGVAEHRTSVIRVYVRPDASDSLLAFTLAHEMAHALDALHVTPDERREYRDLRGIPQPLDWLWEWDGGSDGDFSMPAGDFAESFAVATTGDTGPWASRLGPPPGPSVQQRVLEMASAV